MREREKSEWQKASRMCAWIIAALMSGCGGEPENEGVLQGEPGSRGKADSLTQALATLTFGAEPSETLSGLLKGGGRVQVNYDEARLPKCRGTDASGNQDWQIAVYMRCVPGGHTQEAPLFGPQMTVTGPIRVKKVPTFTVDADAQEIELWFKNRSPAVRAIVAAT